GTREIGIRGQSHLKSVACAMRTKKRGPRVDVRTAPATPGGYQFLKVMTQEAGVAAEAQPGDLGPPPPHYRLPAGRRRRETFLSSSFISLTWVCKRCSWSETGSALDPARGRKLPDSRMWVNVSTIMSCVNGPSGLYQR